MPRRVLSCEISAPCSCSKRSPCCTGQKRAGLAIRATQQPPPWLFLGLGKSCSRYFLVASNATQWFRRRRICSQVSLKPLTHGLLVVNAARVCFGFQRMVGGTRDRDQFRLPGASAVGGADFVVVFFVTWPPPSFSCTATCLLCSKEFDASSCRCRRRGNTFNPWVATSSVLFFGCRSPEVMCMIFSSHTHTAF